MAELQIEQLTVYPVKSLRGISVKRWPAAAAGLAYDRQWMLVMPNGRFVSQRQLPHMALIDTAIEGDRLHLSKSGYGSVSLPLRVNASGNAFIGTVWRDSCPVIEASAEASSWLNRLLKPPQPLRLVTLLQGQQRDADPTRFGPDSHTRFADAAPYLIANQASLEKLNQRLSELGKTSVDMRRFRPNLVISGLEAFAEHNLSQLHHPHSGLNFCLCDPCERCIVTTIDPDTASLAADREPFNTLRALNPMPDNHKAPAFAVNATLIYTSEEDRTTPAPYPVTLTVGDRLLA